MSAPTDTALLAAIETRQTAILSRNTADWLRHTAEDFVLINNRGEIESRDTRLKLLTTSKGTGVVAVTESIRMYGPDNGCHDSAEWIRQLES